MTSCKGIGDCSPSSLADFFEFFCDQENPGELRKHLATEVCITSTSPEEYRQRCRQELHQEPIPVETLLVAALAPVPVPVASRLVPDPGEAAP
jgi:hypothetical protein